MDDRRSGPRYTDLGVPAPLVGDDPSCVRGLAIEVRAGEPQTEYQIGTTITAAGQLRASVPVWRAAPNDIAATDVEQARISAARAAFGHAVREAFAQCIPVAPAKPRAVVVRHHPQRDEDNTWQTWITALCGMTGNRAPGHWSDGAPLAGWRPRAVASIADSAIQAPVCYELWD